MSTVVVVKYAGESEGGALSKDAYKAMLGSALRQMNGSAAAEEALAALVPSGTIGMKTNCLVGRLNSTPIALVDALTEWLQKTGVHENDVVVWERSNRELRRAGFELNASSRGRRCLGTDANGVGYSSDFYSFGEANSLVSQVLTKLVDYNINMPVLKDHSIAGLSGALKNMYGVIHNPNKYHDNNCDPYCAHVSKLAPIAGKSRLVVMDASRVQYHGGPGYRAEHIAPYQGLIASTDPVAADRVGLEIVERLRVENGLPVLKEAGREVKYLRTAQDVGVGTGEMDLIDLVVVQVDERGRERRGELFG